MIATGVKAKRDAIAAGEDPREDYSEADVHYVSQTDVKSYPMPADNDDPQRYRAGPATL